MSFQQTRIGQILQVAHAAYRRGDRDIAQDLFEIVMQDNEATAAFGQKSIEDLVADAKAAMDAGDYEAAAQHMDQIQTIAQDEGCVGDDCTGEGEDLPFEEGDEEDEGDGTLSPGDIVDPPPIPELGPVDAMSKAQFISVAKLARKISAGGHPDLAQHLLKAIAKSTETKADVIVPKADVQKLKKMLYAADDIVEKIVDMYEGGDQEGSKAHSYWSKVREKLSGVINAM